jgi:hypothetical protein
MEDQTRCVVRRIPTTTQQVVNVTVCEAVQQKGRKTVCDIVRNLQEVTVNVCSFEHQPREGVRTICDTVTEKVKQKVQVCTMVPYEETIRVQVGGVCATSCSNDCGNNCGQSRGHRGGLFRRGGGCCN